MIRQVELVERVLSYDADADEDLLNRAYVFSLKAHGSQKRASGDPYFSHPLEVAAILTGFKLDTATIATALLHDTIEDTVATYAEIEKLFGVEIAKLVDGVTKLSRLEIQSERNKQAENFRKLLLAMSNDIRVLLVKLADRLHNMRTLQHIKDPDKRKRIAVETVEIYAPLAERIGMQEVKDELEDIAFGELHADARASILSRLEYLRGTDGSFVTRIEDELKRTLANAGVESWISGRQKRPVSIWRKMQSKDVAFEQLSDIVAFRIVVADIEACYKALGVVHAAYPMVPGRFKDYVSTPKPNGYRSIHTTVLGPEGYRIEMQIRSTEMQEIAEVGVAAHWRYKQRIVTAEGEGQQYRWLRELLEILEQAEDPEEFLEHTKLSMFQDQVFCFTPKGDLFSLPRGSTPVDFAYAVHSDVGDTCVGSKVNGRLVPLRTELANGDQVEILRSKTQTPSPTWESFVVTGKARACIRRFIRNQQRDEYAALGRQILQKAFKEAGETFAEKAVDAAVKSLKMKTVEDVYVALGDGSVHDRSVMHAIFPGRDVEQSADEKVVSLARARARAAKGDSAVSIRGLIPGMALHFAGCCHPLPGDRIVGIVTTGRGVTIHTIDCDTLEQLVDQPDRWLDVAWDRDVEADDQRFTGRIHTVVTNEPGALSALTTVIARYKANINNLRITNRSTEFFEMALDLEVKDVKHLTNIIAALRASPMISSVERARG